MQWITDQWPGDEAFPKLPAAIKKMTQFDAISQSYL